MSKLWLTLSVLVAGASACSSEPTPAASPTGVASASPTGEASASPTGVASASPTGQPVGGTYPVAGHRVYVECSGEGSTTVVLIHGLGGNSSDWFPTRSAIPELRTCVYDRVNAGRSEQDPDRRTATDAAAELGGVLDVVSAGSPVVLVGHSFGGMLALLYAATNPGDVRGILLVDAALPFEADLDPPELREQIRAELDDNPEHLDFYEAFGETGAVMGRLPVVPITYLYGALQDLAPEWAPGAYEDALHEFVDGLPRGTLIEEQSGHAMPIEIPEEVAAQARKLVRLVQAR